MYDSVSLAPEIPNPLARADALEREITDLCAQINAAGYRFLQLVAELDDEAPWGAWGLTSCAHWLNRRCGIGMNAAREGGFGVERTADSSIRFSRPDGRFIEEHPQLPESGSVEALLRGKREAGEAIDAASWIIPGDTLNYGIAIEGLIRKQGQKSNICETAR